MFKATQRLRVEWAQCDPAGIIYNPNYYIWMDGGTHALLQAAGFDFIGRTADDSDFVGCSLVASNMEFKSPLYFGDLVTLTSQVEKFGNTSFVIAHAFTRGNNPNPVARGAEVRVWAHCDPGDRKRLVARPVPEEIRKLLSVDRVVDVSA